ncbi:hypothetical protein F2P81_012407 [Scophthalmus maximus]|uniref:Lipid-binding serum glycoprotein C-terminal domain-containing protein n=1 Tax=Scophthalmus maximus TaxID=52904 RepID=A0A6A4SPJ2_SCOMX|nr:hypothetical protein F2P81_012407 [Scophthalmus maximus]
MLETIPVKTEVDNYIGIDYSLIDDPVVTSRSLDMNFRGMFFDLGNPNDTLANHAIDPVISNYDRMVYFALSEFFFDSGMFAYYRAEIFQMHIINEKVTATTDPQNHHRPSQTPKTTTDSQNHHRPSKPPQTFKDSENHYRPLQTTTDTQNHHRLSKPSQTL